MDSTLKKLQEEIEMLEIKKPTFDAEKIFFFISKINNY